MKIGIIGGAGVRTPLLSAGLARSDLPLEEIALFDPGRDRLGVIASLAEKMAGRVRVRSCDTVADCVRDADFVFTSFRVGGIEARARNEAAALRLGLIGQETVGFAGCAMALATVPEMVRYAREVERVAPRAWIVNFTNPVGIVTQAVKTATGARIVGICDTPTELFEEVAAELGVPSSECHFDYFGLNHLGWLREVVHRGTPRLGELFREPERLAKVYRTELFPPERLVELKLLPTEYVYFYDQPERALGNLKKAGESRGKAVARLTARLFDDLASGKGDPVAVYEAYLAERDASYFAIESAGGGTLKRPASAELTGYDKIALATVRAMHFNTGAVIPLDVLNRGNIPELAEDDVIEVPCVVNASGPQPLSVPRVPASVRDLLVRIKEYERLTLRAALEDSRELATEALALNPLVADRDLAEQLLTERETA